MKVTNGQLEAAIEEYARTPRPGVRLGQFLMNRLVPGEACSEVFYEQDNLKAVDEFISRFVGVPEVVGKVLRINTKGMSPVTDEMWEAYLNAPVPEGFEATGEVRCSQMDEIYLNPVAVWNNLEPEAIREEYDWTGYTHYQFDDEPVKSIDEPPIARRIIRRKA